MVQKKAEAAGVASSKRPRGRPRNYDPELALRQALEAFWTHGYSGTSLDDLGAAMGMNRPSLYAAFGDKRALYLKALESYWDQALAAMRALLSRDEPLAQALMRIYDSALSLYFPPSGAPRGCFGISTAAVERRIARAVEQGELPATANPRTLAEIASALLHTLAIRSRYGATRKELRRLAERAVMQMLQA